MPLRALPQESEIRIALSQQPPGVEFGQAGRDDLGCRCPGVVRHAANIEGLLHAVPDHVFGANVAVPRLPDAADIDEMLVIRLKPVETFLEGDIQERAAVISGDFERVSMPDKTDSFRKLLENRALDSVFDLECIKCGGIRREPVDKAEGWCGQVRGPS